MKLNIDQLLEHIAPWDFVVRIDGVDYPTCRPSIAELGAARSIAGKDLNQIIAVVTGFFVTPPPDQVLSVPVVMAFMSGYLAYFERHAAQKKEGAPTAEQMARTAVLDQWTAENAPAQVSSGS